VDDHPDDQAEAVEAVEAIDLPDTFFDDELEALAADDGESDEDPEEDDDGEVRHNALPRRVESWRSRSATGAVISAMAMGLRQVFEPERRKPAIIAEAPSDPYDDDDPVVVDYVADDASGTKVILRPWLMPGGVPPADPTTTEEDGS